MDPQTSSTHKDTLVLDSILTNENGGILKEEIISSGDNIWILYSTLAIVACLILIWIIVIVITRETHVKVLGNMTSSENQINPIGDII